MAASASADGKFARFFIANNESLNDFAKNELIEALLFFKDKTLEQNSAFAAVQKEISVLRTTVNELRTTVTDLTCELNAKNMALNLSQQKADSVNKSNSVNLKPNRKNDCSSEEESVSPKRKGRKNKSKRSRQDSPVAKKVTSSDHLEDDSMCVVTDLVTQNKFFILDNAIKESREIPNVENLEPMPLVLNTVSCSISNVQVSNDECNPQPNSQMSGMSQTNSKATNHSVPNSGSRSLSTEAPYHSAPSTSTIPSVTNGLQTSAGLSSLSFMAANHSVPATSSPSNVPIGSQSSGLSSLSTGTPILTVPINANSNNSQFNTISATGFSPITISDYGDWGTLRNELKNITSGNFKSTAYGKELKLIFYNSNDYRATTRYLVQHSIKHIAFPIDAEKQIRVVLKKIPDHIPLPDIKADLENQNFTIRRIIRLPKAPTISSCALVIVNLPITDASKKIYQVVEILGLSVIIQPFEKRQKILQCYNCQKFGHGASACFFPPVCVKCGAGHQSRTCTKPRTTPGKCVNCGGGHVASFRNCPAFPKSNSGTTTIQNPVLQNPPVKNTINYPVLPNSNNKSKFTNPARSYSQVASTPSDSALLKSSISDLQQRLFLMEQNQANFLESIRNMLSSKHG